MRGLGGCTYVRLFPRASEASMSFRKYRNWPFLTAFLKPGIWNDRISSIKPASLHKNPPSFLRKKTNKQTNKQSINQSSKPLAQSNKTMEFKKRNSQEWKKNFLHASFRFTLCHQRRWLRVPRDLSRRFVT